MTTAPSALVPSVRLKANNAIVAPSARSTKTFAEYPIFHFLTKIRILANADRLGFSNVTDPCYTARPFGTATTAACGPAAENIGELAYWNNVHPTRGVQRGTKLPVPEPASWGLMIVGFAMTGLARRLRPRSLRGPVPAGLY